MQNKRFPVLAVISIVLLLIPFIAMQFSSEVNWTTTDFIIAAGLLLSAALLFEIAIRKIQSNKFKLILLGVFLIILILIWIELAVGIFGTPIAGN